MNNEIILIRKLVVRLLRGWPVILVTLFLTTGLALFVGVVSPQFYNAEVSIMVEEPYRIDDPQRWILGEQRFNEPGRAYIVNEGIRMKELSLIKATCDSLGLGVKYLSMGSLVDEEIYHKAPFRVHIDTLDHSMALPYGIAFEVSESDDNTYRIQAEGEYGPDEISLELDVTTAMGKPFKVAGLSIRLEPVSGLSFGEYEDLAFQLVNTEELTLELSEAIEIDAVELEASIFTAGLIGAPRDKEVDILDALSHSYVKTKLNERKEVLLHTLKTIQEEMKVIQSELARQEQEIETYKSKESINSTEDEGKSLLEEIASMEVSRIDLQTRKEYLVYLANSVDSLEGGQNLVVPSAYGVSDPALNELVSSYNELLLKKQLYETSEQTAHPVYKTLASELVSKAEIIKQTVKGFTQSNDLRLLRLTQEVGRLKKRSAQLPYQQMELLRKDRSFHALDLNYRALNQRRVEVGIALASLSADVRIIEKAHATSIDPIFPDPVVLGIFIVLLSLASPFVYLLLKTLFGDRITDVEELRWFINQRETGIELITLRHGAALNPESLKNSESAPADQDVGDWAGNLIKKAAAEPQLIAVKSHVSSALFHESISPLLARFEAMKFRILVLDFTAGNGQDYRSFMDSVSETNPGSTAQAYFPSGGTMVKKIEVAWTISDAISPGDQEALNRLKSDYQLLIMLLPGSHWSSASLADLSDMAIELNQYGVASKSTIEAQLNKSSGQQQVVLAAMPPAAFHLKAWITLFRTRGGKAVKMLFNRI